MSESRADKLVKLAEFMDLEHGTLDESQFPEEALLLDKGTQFKVLAAKIKRCKKCPGLNVKRLTEACAGWGNLNAQVMFVGQSLHMPGMVSAVPFVGNSGLLIIAALRLSNLSRQDCFWTNVVHCHPENNRASTEKEKRNCLVWLKKELRIVKPKLVVALGNDAKEAVEDIDGEWKVYKCKHPAAVLRDEIAEQTYDWIVKLSLKIDETLYPSEKKRKTRKELERELEELKDDLPYKGDKK